MTEAARRHWSSRIAIIGPLALFAAFVILVATQLGRPTQEIVHSKMVGKPLPALNLPGLAGAPGLTTADFTTGKPVLVNVFASWCLPCQAEAAQLAALQKSGVTIHAIAVRDDPVDVAAFLGKHGNPFSRIGLDKTGQTQIAMGSSGVPETFVIDGEGRIRYQHIGEVRAEDLAKLQRELGKAG